MHGHRVPRQAGDFGMALFLAALAMLFGASMVGYVIIRVMKTRDVLQPGTDVVAYPATAPPLWSIHLPLGLWISTLIILLSSVSIHMALKQVRRERQGRFRGWLIATLLLAILFLLVQAPSLAMLILEHFNADTDHTLLGLIFFLILLHALHVVGGIIPLAVITYRAGQDRYDHEQHDPVRHLAAYWHFLDMVWVVMFLTFLATR